MVNYLRSFLYKISVRYFVIAGILAAGRSEVLTIVAFKVALWRDFWVVETE